MKKRLTLLYTAAIILPMAALVLFGTRAVLNERYRYKESVVNGYSDHLALMKRDVMRVLEECEERLLAARPVADLPPEEIRQFLRESSLVRQLFVIGSGEELLFPSREGAGSRETEFFERTAILWEGGVDFTSLPEASSAQRGWYTYYDGNVTSYIHWQLLEDGRLLGAELFRETLIADIFAAMSGWERGEEERERILLRDELGRDLYLSGDYRPEEQEAPLATALLPAPFAGWRLEAYAGKEITSPPGTGLPLLLAALALLVALGGSGFLLYRETGREIEEAGKKVSFVNQVSHELKTPLTNIRMYAELLTGRLPEESRERDFAGVILRESERLSRIISNVLSFSRQAPRVRPEMCDPDGIIRRVAGSVFPAGVSSVSVEFEGGCPGPMELDADILEQISWNLLGNAGKYAAQGGRVLVSTALEGEMFTASFRDWGPGIPARKSEAVFRPFYRVKESLTEGVSGTGLGLSISRELARAHGGELRLEHPGKGCLFLLTLKTGGGAP